MEVYTLRNNPFRFGGKYDIIKTDIEEYERVSIGKGYFGILFYNPKKLAYHIALDGCGALIGTDMSKKRLIARVRKDVETGDKKIMKQQVEQGIVQLKQAEKIPFEEFCILFKT